MSVFKEDNDKRDLMTFPEFCKRLIADGAYIGDDNHIYAKGRRLSRRARNGYYTLRKSYDGHDYCFMEHRVIWYFYYGDIDEGLVINHKDFDRANNAIGNLELITQKENINYSKKEGRHNPPRADKSGKAIYSNLDVQTMRYLRKQGYSTKQIAALFKGKYENSIRRLLNGDRYGSVDDNDNLMELYPVFVERTWRNDLPKDERIKNALLGIAGEMGELIDLYKKVFYQGHEIDTNAVISEAGDILYYLVALLNECNLRLEDVCYDNINKLYARYPNGFEIDKSLHRREGDT